MTTIALTILIVLAAIILLMITGLILWQRKAGARLNNVQENLLQHIESLEKSLALLKKEQDISKDLALEEIRKGFQEIQSGHPGDPIISEPSDTCPPGKEDMKDSLKQEKQTEIIDDTLPQSEAYEFSADNEKSQSEGVNPDRGGQMPEPSIYNVGKSGKVYTEEELELLIKE